MENVIASNITAATSPNILEGMRVRIIDSYALHEKRR